MSNEIAWKYNNEWDWDESMPIWEDCELSAAAKGVWAYMRSRPHGWDFSAERVGVAMGLAKKTVLKYMKEMEEFGYLRGLRVKGRRMQYSLSAKRHEWGYTIKVHDSGHFPKQKNIDYVESHGCKNPTLKAAVEYLTVAYGAYEGISPFVIENMLTLRAKWGSYADLNEWMVENKELVCSYFGIEDVDYGF